MQSRCNFSEIHPDLPDGNKPDGCRGPCWPFITLAAGIASGLRASKSSRAKQLAQVAEPFRRFAFGSEQPP
jgi:hypothetical protein